MTRKFFILSFIAFIFSSNLSAQYVSEATQKQTEIKHVRAQVFNREIQKTENPQIIDIRTPREFAAAHIKGAVLINFYDPAFVQNIEKAKLDKNKPVFVYCRSGNRSGHAMQIFIKLGFKIVYNLQYGINDWVRSGLSLER